MRVDGLISAGYAIVCDCGEAFALERIGIAVECPACGHSVIGTDLALDYHLKRGQARHPAASDTIPATG